MAKTKTSFQKGHIPANKGIYNELYSYNTLHRFIQRNFVKAGCCEYCFEEKKTEWANVTGVYSRDRNDYKELCIPCHRAEDKQNPKRVNFERGFING
jgi:hypothetical protein